MPCLQYILKLEPHGKPNLDNHTLDWLKRYGLTDAQLQIFSMQYAKSTSPCEAYLHLIGEPTMVCEPTVHFYDTSRPDRRVRKEFVGG